MKGLFYIVGPTAVGKSSIAAAVAERLGAEIVSADAFQVYQGLDILTAKPDAATLARVPHHLISVVPLSEEMNVERFRAEALRLIDDIRSRGRLALVAGGSGFYVKALTHGLSPLPTANAALRARLAQFSHGELAARLQQLDPAGAQTVDLNNPRRVIRAIEIILLTGQSLAQQRRTWSVSEGSSAPGVLLLRDRADLYARIHQRVERMFEEGVVDEVRRAQASSETSAHAIGFVALQALIEGRITRGECIAAIQLATRRYAKRQLTWFRHQSNFEALNLTPLTHGAAVDWITEKVFSLS